MLTKSETQDIPAVAESFFSPSALEAIKTKKKPSPNKRESRLEKFLANPPSFENDSIDGDDFWNNMLNETNTSNLTQNEKKKETKKIDEEEKGTPKQDEELQKTTSNLTITKEIIPNITLPPILRDALMQEKSLPPILADALSGKKYDTKGSTPRNKYYI